MPSTKNKLSLFSLANKTDANSSNIVATINLSLFCSILSGVLQALSWSEEKLMLLMFVALIPLVVAIYGQKPKRAFYLGWVYGLILNIIGLYWVADVLAGYGGLGFLLAWAVLFVLASFLALYSGIFTFLMARFQLNNLILWVFLGATVFCGLDWLKNWLLTGFNWLPLAAPISVSPLLLQAADLFGIYGMGFFVALLNISLAVIIIKLLKKDKKSATIKQLGFIIFSVLCFWLIYSSFTLNQWTKLYEGAKYEKVVALQPSIPQDAKWEATQRKETFKKYEDLALKADERDPFLIIWPETAMPFIFGLDDYETFWLYDLVDKIDSPMLVGIGAFQIDENKKLKTFNRALLFKNSLVDSYYDKQHLVPFGEYLPFSENLAIFDWILSQGIIGAAGSHSKGETTKPIVLGNLNLGVLICYESIFPYMAKKRVSEGANVFIITTNDAWFGESFAPRQHLYQAAMRAVEMRRPVVRVGNNGISAEITAYGFIEKKSNLNDIGIFDFKIPTNLQLPTTIYYRYTFYFPVFCAIGTSFLFFVALFKRKNKKINL